jgi:anti-anti-sigma factor
MAIDVNIQRSGRAMLVEVVGDLDIEGASALSVGPDGDVDLVIVDARRLAFIDSSGLNAIVALYHQLRGENATLRLVVTPESMMRHILRITDLDTIIPVVDKLETSLVAAN